MLWPLLIAAALTGAVVAAALMLWLNAHVARVHNRMHANIEEYQALNNHSQASISFNCNGGLWQQAILPAVERAVPMAPTFKFQCTEVACWLHLEICGLLPP